LTVVAFERKPEPRSHQEVPQPKECDESTCVLSCIAARNNYPRRTLPGETAIDRTSRVLRDCANVFARERLNTP